MIYLTFTITIIACILLLISALAFFKAKDVFMMIQIVKIAGFYIIPLMLIAIWLNQPSIVALVKIISLIIINILSTILICNLIARKALQDKIIPDFKTK